jgi:hypothetical protein
MQPDEILEIISRDEFFRRYPPETRGIRINEKFIPIGTEIVCDICNAEISSDIGLYADYALCEVCTHKVQDEINSK